jgi:hypothetical protein
MAARGGGVVLRHIKLERDVYYTSPSLDRWGSGSQHEYVDQLRRENRNRPNRWVRGSHGFRGWGTTGNPIHLRKSDDADRDEFFCLGDNSTQSFDGRSWTAAAPSLPLYDENGKPQYQLGAVPRANLLGRALMVYWPAGYRLPILDWPLIPNVGRMRLIR